MDKARRKLLLDDIAEGVTKAYNGISEIVDITPLQRNIHLSDAHKANIFLKREDLQPVRSYKIRGAYHKLISLPDHDLNRGVSCASAGNHAQGVAYACNMLKTSCKIYMPNVTPKQKINKVRQFGESFAKLIITGDSFEETYSIALSDSRESGRIFVHPFDDPEVIKGQGTVGLELLHQADQPLDYILLPIGGGGLAAGVAAYCSKHSPQTKIIGVEPEGAASMYASLKAGTLVTLEKIDSFVDGAAVRRVGSINYEICRAFLEDVLTVPEGKICTTILKLYNEDAIVLEPAGALSIAALDQLSSEIRGKNVACIVSGGNNDITRMEEIKERSLLYEGLKHYFIIRFPQRSGALKDFLNVLGPNDDIAHFEYTKKNNRETGPALVGIELQKKEDYHSLISRMEEKSINYMTVNDDPMLFEMLV